MGLLRSLRCLAHVLALTAEVVCPPGAPLVLRGPAPDAGGDPVLERPGQAGLPRRQARQIRCASAIWRSAGPAVPTGKNSSGSACLQASRQVARTVIIRRCA